ncbi:MAG TPA: ABC transporter permease, partial [Trueperaceae bacterium]
MPLAFRLAYRTLLRHPWRTLATTLGVAIGIAAVLATLSVGENVQANVQSTLVAAAGKADLLVTPGAQGRAVFAIDDIRTIIEKTPGIARIHPVLNYRAEPVRHIQEFEDTVIPGVDTGFQLSGRETSMPADLPTSAKVGHLPARGSMGVAIAEGFAKGRGIEVGDEVPFATTFGDIPFKVTGLLDDSLGLASTNGGRVGLANLHDLQKALRLEGRASYLELILEEGADADKVRTELQDSLGEAYAVTLPAGSGDVTMGVVNTLQAGLRVLAVTLIALGGFMAYNTFAAGVVERRREYALLRTICLTRRQVVRLALAESLAISILGVLVGLALGVGLSVLLTRLNALALGFEFRTLVVPLWTVAVASVVGVAVAMFAGLLPARSASETPPLAAMREPDEPHADRSPPLGWLLLVLGVGSSLAPWPGNWALLGAGLAMVLLFAGIALLGPILLPLALRVLRPALTRLLGTAGKLGAGFTLRNAQRNGVAIGAVIIGMGLTIGVGSMIAGINREISDWVDTTIIGDMFVTSPVSFPAGFEKDVKKRVPDLEAVSGVGLRVVRFQPEGGERGRSVALVLVDPDRFNPDGGFGRFEFIQNQGNAESAYRALKQGGRVLAANTILDRFGIGRGDVARLRTSEGFRDFPVAGVVVDFTGGGEAFVASIEDADLFGGGTP